MYRSERLFNNKNSMKKIAVTTALLIAGTLFVNAQTETATEQRDMMRRLPPQMASSSRPMMGSSTRPMMGSSTRPALADDKIGMQVKALNMEMEVKIKAIREEYKAKLKLIVGSSTRFMMREDGKIEENMARPVMASTTRAVPPRMREAVGQVRGAMIGEGNQDVSEMKEKLMNFFKGFLGAN